MNPIFEALKLNERFFFPLLAGEVEDLKLFWLWWWETHPLTKLDRPYTINDDDPILATTLTKKTVDTQSGLDFYEKDLLGKCLEKKLLPFGANIPRDEYRERLVSNFTALSSKLETPTVFFSGGGYGSGKTSSLDFLRSSGYFPFPQASIFGPDSFKLYLPEFNQIRMVADGRASSIVQDEAQVLASALFNRLVQERRSFAWDTSMSNAVETTKRLEALRSAGYVVKLIAVFTDVLKATQLAMKRAKETRRFPHPVHLPESHKGFKNNFMGYLDYFSEIKVFYNDPQINCETYRDPILIAETNATSKSLVIMKRELFHSFVPLHVP